MGMDMDLDAYIAYKRRTSIVERQGGYLKGAALICTTTTLPPLLALPSALAALTWAGGLTVTLVASFVAFYCFHRVVELNEFGGMGSHKTYPDLASVASGRKWVGEMVKILQYTLSWGVGVTNIILASEFMMTLYAASCSGCTTLNQTYFSCITTGIIILIGFLPDFSEQNVFIVFNGTFTIVYSTIAIILSFLNSRHSTADFSLPGSEASIAFNALANIGVVFFIYGDTLYPELQSYLKPDSSGSTIQPMKKGLYLAFSITLPLILAVGISGYWSFGTNVSPTLFTAEMQPLWLVFVAVVAAIIQTNFSVHIYAQPLYNSMELWLLKRLSGQKWSRHETRGAVVASVWLMALIRIAYAFSLGITAVIFPFFAAIMGFIGAAFLTPLTYVIPLSLWAIANKTRPNYKLTAGIHISLAVIFAAGGLLAAIGAIRNIIVSFGTFDILSA
jgi:hypothetical protein